MKEGVRVTYGQGPADMKKQALGEDMEVRSREKQEARKVRHSRYGHRVKERRRQQKDSQKRILISQKNYREATQISLRGKCTTFHRKQV